MKFVLFYHSLVSDWNHGNAHFLRGVASELIERGHEVVVREPEDGWSVTNLVAEHGERPLARFRRAYPTLADAARPYRPESIDLDRAFAGADVVVVHEWTDPELVRAIGRHRRAGGGYRLLFHDTHHRSLSRPEEIEALGLRRYDAVLAYGAVIRDIYLARGWARHVHVWHEAADTRRFRPRPDAAETGDLVWIGNWGDEERTAEIEEFLLRPVAALGLRARVFGVRYPDLARRALAKAGIEYGGWLPNFDVPRVLSSHRVTVHIPRRPYARDLPGIPTIRPFEALACGTPMVSSPWTDSEGLFGPDDWLLARDGDEMRSHLSRLLGDPARRRRQAERGVRTIRARHTCAHRVDELLSVLDGLGSPAGAARGGA